MSGGEKRKSCAETGRLQALAGQGQAAEHIVAFAERAVPRRVDASERPWASGIT